MWQLGWFAIRLFWQMSMILGLKNLVVTRPQQGVFSGTWKGFGVLGRTHKTTLRGRRREHSKVVFSILTPVAPTADYSLRDGYITQSESPDNAGLFRIYRTCYTFKRTEWEWKRTEPKQNFTEDLRKNLENHIVGHYLCIVDNVLARQLYRKLSDRPYG